jgi:hypothetical protein
LGDGGTHARPVSGHSMLRRQPLHRQHVHVGAEARSSLHQRASSPSVSPCRIGIGARPTKLA